MKAFLVICIVLAVIVASSEAATTAAPCKSQPAINKAAGDKFVNSPGCPSESTYQQYANGNRYNCHCWGRCGYWCNVIAATTAAPTTKKTSPCVNGGVYVPPNNPTQRCVCQTQNNVSYYKCTKTSTAASATPSSSASSPTSVSTSTTTGAPTPTSTTMGSTTPTSTTTGSTTPTSTTTGSTTPTSTTTGSTTSTSTTTPATG